MKKIKNHAAIFPIVVLTLGALFFVTPAVMAQEAENLTLAKKLVEQAQLHELSALGMRLAVRRAVADGKATQAFLECVSAVPSGVFSTPITALYATKLTSSELTSALGFFESGAGKKYIAYSFRRLQTQAGFTPAAPAVTVTAEEQRSIENFLSSALGNQLSGAQSPLGTAARSEISKVVAPILAGCGRHGHGPIPTQGTSVGEYVSAIVRVVKGNLLYAGDLSRVEGNPQASFRVEQLPTGEVAAVKIIQSSGHPDFDDAALKAIHKSSPLPKRADGIVERLIILNFSMKETPSSE